MIIYGSRMYGRKDEVKGWKLCEHCGKYGRSRCYTGRKWGHIYFIPLIPEGKKARVLWECKSCSNGVHIPLDDLETYRPRVKQECEDALKAVLNGEKTIEHEGEQVSALQILLANVDTLRGIREEKFLQLTLGALEKKNRGFELKMLRAQLEELNGHPDEAVRLYNDAARLNPDSPEPLIWLGSVHMSKGDPGQAAFCYEKAKPLVDDPFRVLQPLVAVYMQSKNHGKLADTYEELFQAFPEIKEDKKVRKDYHKALKKSGRKAA